MAETFQKHFGVDFFLKKLYFTLTDKKKKKNKRSHRRNLLVTCEKKIVGGGVSNFEYRLFFKIHTGVLHETVTVQRIAAERNRRNSIIIIIEKVFHYEDFTDVYSFILSISCRGNRKMSLFYTIITNNDGQSLRTFSSAVHRARTARFSHVFTA